MKNSHCCQKKQHPEGDTLMEKNNNTKNTELELERGQNEQRGIGWCDGKSMSRLFLACLSSAL